jgi:MFS family permease
MILRKTVLCLALSQLISWGISYYLIGGFGEPIAADFGWTREFAYGGFAVALLVMGLFSPAAGHLIDWYGGRRIMVAGSLANAAGCTGLALSHGVGSYYAAWICLGIAMRLTLYDAAFAALVRIGGIENRIKEASNGPPCQFPVKWQGTAFSEYSWKTLHRLHC